jgi:hypothetical protein
VLHLKRRQLGIIDGLWWQARGIERYVEAAHRSGSHVDGQRQPGSAKGVTLVFIDDEHVD